MDSNNRHPSVLPDVDFAVIDTTMRREARRAQDRTAEDECGKATFDRRNIVSKPLSARLSEKSLQVALAAIEIYNKPVFSYREESFSILMTNAWELMLKAKWVLDHDEDEGSLHVVNRRTGASKKNRSGNPLTMGAFDLSKALLADNTSGLETGCHNNLLALLEIRDNVVHFLHGDLHLGRRVLEIGTASLRNYAQLAQDWFGLDLSEYDMLLMPVSFRHGFETAESISGVVRNEKVQNLLEYINGLERDQPADGTQRVAIYLETKLVRERSESAIGFKWTNDPDAPALLVREEDALKNYPMTYRQLTEKMKTRYSDFVENGVYHKLRKGLEEDRKYCMTRLLNPKNPRSSKKRFYNANIFQEFDRRYQRRAASG